MDRDIQQLLAAGRLRAAFERLVDRYQNKVFRLACAMLRNTARAEEAAQDSFLKLWQALPAYDGRASLSTWLYTIARNTCLSQLRADSYRRTAPLEDAPELPAPGGAHSGALDVRDLVARLPEEQRRVVELFYLQERSVADVAAALDLPEGTVKSHLHRARRSLAALLEVKS